MPNDHAELLRGWLRQQLGDDASLIHQGGAHPIGDNDIAEVFTVAVPASQMEQLFRLTNRRGTVEDGRLSMRVQHIKAVDTMVCSRGQARRSFVIHAESLQW